MEELGLKGFNNVSLDLRSRYEIKRDFAPYVGVSWTRRLGDTADFAEAQGEEIKNTAIIAGVRALVLGANACSIQCRCQRGASRGLER